MTREKQTEILTDEYDNRTSELLSKYDFILDNESDYTFPEEKNSRYELFKNSTCEFEFLNLKREYLTNTTRPDDSNYIKGSILDLNRILEDERLTHNTKKNETYKKAVDYFSSILDYSDKDLDDESKTIFFISLYQNEYFNKVEVPELAFFLDYPNGKKLELLSTVYAQYFLFYEYLITSASHLALEIKYKPTLNGRKNRIQELKEKTLKEIWSKGDIAKYDVAMEFLKTYVHNKELDQPFIIDNKNGGYTWLYTSDSQRYLGAFIFVCMRENFIPQLSAPILASICCNTFSLDRVEKENLTNLYSNEPKDKFLKHFNLMFR
ncbi:MAG: hypothetical protein WC716_04465 [Chitinophagaceae bacterium]|jgi:hypothetical protein